MQLLATYRHARDDGLQPLSQASSVDNQPRRRALTSPSTTEASCRRRKQAGWRGVSAGGDYASLLLGAVWLSWRGVPLGRLELSQNAEKPRLQQSGRRRKRGLLTAK